MKFHAIIITFLLFFFSALAFSTPAPFYSFDSLSQEQLFTRLTTESRCLVCQNQSLGDSDAPLAVDLRNNIYHLVKQGKDEKMIQDFLVERYGDYILLRPPINKSTWILWASPILLLVFGFGILFYYLRNN